MALRLLDTYAAKSCKNIPPLHVSLNITAARPSFRNLAAELLRETCKGGIFLHDFEALVSSNLKAVMSSCTPSL